MPTHFVLLSFGKLLVISFYIKFVCLPNYMLIASDVTNQPAINTIKRGKKCEEKWKIVCYASIETIMDFHGSL